MKVWVAAALVAAFSWGAGSLALAQEEGQDQPPSAYVRPHTWRAELRFSTTYFPYQIDQGLKQQTFYPDGLGTAAVSSGPFGALYGGRHRLLGETEVDRDLLTGFGSLGVGVGFSYAEFYGTGYHVDRGVYVGSGDGSGFHLGQARLLAIYRFDYFVPSGIPLVPFAKAGLGWAYYWNQLSSGKLTPNVSGNGNSQGLVTGVEASLGLSLLLDVIDPVLSRDLYQDLSIAHTYLNGSYTWQDYENGPSDLVHAIFNGGAKASPALNLSTGFFDFGVSVEF